MQSIFSINNFNQKSFLKTTFEWVLKAMVSIKCICKCIRFFFDFAVHKLCRTLENSICSWHITNLFPVLHRNKWMYVQIVSSPIYINLYWTFNGSDALLHKLRISVLHWLNLQIADELFECVWPFCGIGA